MVLATDQVWHHWLAWILIFPVIAVIVALLVGYLATVVAPKYGRR